LRPNRNLPSLASRRNLTLLENRAEDARIRETTLRKLEVDDT